MSRSHRKSQVTDSDLGHGVCVQLCHIFIWQVTYVNNIKLNAVLFSSFNINLTTNNRRK